jgi:hypothetical protein
MTNRSTKIKVLGGLLGGLLVAFLSLGGGSPTASASPHTNGMRVNGMRVNGMRVNGMRVNGMRVNGMRVNGTSVDGAQSRPEVDGIILLQK